MNVVIYCFEFGMLGLCLLLAVANTLFVTVDGSGSMTNKAVRVNTRERYDERLQNVFSNFISFKVGRIDGDSLSLSLSFIIVTNTCSQKGSYLREIDECEERRDEQDSLLILYIAFLCFVWLV